MPLVSKARASPAESKAGKWQESRQQQTVDSESAMPCCFCFAFRLCAKKSLESIDFISQASSFFSRDRHQSGGTTENHSGIQNRKP